MSSSCTGFGTRIRSSHHLHFVWYYSCEGDPSSLGNALAKVVTLVDETKYNVKNSLNENQSSQSHSLKSQLQFYFSECPSSRLDKILLVPSMFCVSLILFFLTHCKLIVFSVFVVVVDFEDFNDHLLHLLSLQSPLNWLLAASSNFNCLDAKFHCRFKHLIPKIVPLSSEDLIGTLILDREDLWVHLGLAEIFSLK